MTAAVYSARKRVKTLLLTINIGGQVLLTSEVENYMRYQYIGGRGATSPTPPSWREP